MSEQIKSFNSEKIIKKELSETDTKEGIKNEIILTPEQEEKGKRFANFLKKGFIREAFIEFNKKTAFLPEEFIQQAVEEGFINCLENGWFDDIKRIKENFNISEEFLQSEEVQQVAKKGFVKFLKGKGMDRVMEFKEYFNISEEFLQSEEVQQVAKEEFEKIFHPESLFWAKELNEKIPLPEEFIQQVAMNKFVEFLNKGFIGDAKKITEEISLPEEFIQQAAEEGIISCLEMHKEESLQSEEVQQTKEKKLLLPNDIVKIKENFNISEEFLKSEEVQQTVKKEFLYWLNRKDANFIDKAVEIAEEIPMSKELLQSKEIQEIMKKEFVNCLNKGLSDIAIKIQKEISLPEEFIQQAAENGFISCLINEQLDSALKIKKHFNISEEFMQSGEVIQAVKKRLAEYLSKGQIDNAMIVKEIILLPEKYIQRIGIWAMVEWIFNGNVDMAFEIRDQFDIKVSSQNLINKSPEIKKLLLKLEKISPEFYNQALKSVDVVITLFPFIQRQDSSFMKRQDRFLKTVKENPFLLEAISSNPRFGSKLLTKYPNFKEDSQEDIKFLFNVKKEIMQNNPEINPQSFEFRQAMQEKLKNYKNNPQILEEIKESGIDVEKWLDYEEIECFSLESGQISFAFSETITTPIDRIRETINDYVYKVKMVLKDYKTELENNYTQKNDFFKTQDKIDKLKKEKNKSKIQKIQKNIDNLEKKLKKIKSISLWNKLMGDINSFNRLEKNIFKTHENLTNAEKLFQQHTQNEEFSAKEIMQKKQELAKIKEDIKINLDILERRMENFRSNFFKIISPALGNEKTKVIEQKIYQELEDQFNHYDTDKTTLANLFSKETDKDKEKLERRKMSVFVWARNPDIDLYQGNYSPCCISIESKEESTIVDYNTDIGIQIINIWDEAKNEPVIAAWCWLGINEKGETAIVVDNIEANTIYSTNYPQQLTKEIFKYLENYAKHIGVKKVVLGKSNNDLPVVSYLTEMELDDQVYEKIGGYNRQSGYYLEAEEKKVKIVWAEK